MTLVLGPFVGLLVGGFIAYVSPKQYESTAIIQVRPLPSEEQILSGHAASAEWSRFISTETEVIRSSSTLELVIDQLDLATRWGVSRIEALNRLARAISTRNIAGTNLIEIRVLALTPIDARIIADSGVEAYEARRRREQTRSSGLALVELRDTVRAQEDLVDERRKLLSRLRAAAFSDADEAGVDDATTSGVSRHDFDDAKFEFESARALLEQLKVKLVHAEMQERIVKDPLTVHAQPVAAATPVLPNIPRLLLSGALGGLVLGLVAPFFLIPLLHIVKKPAP